MYLTINPTMLISVVKAVASNVLPDVKILCNKAAIDIAIVAEVDV